MIAGEAAEVTWEKFSYGVMCMLSERFANPAKFHEMHNQMMCAMEYSLIQDVLGQRLDHIEARYPADWWQACKARWLPAWAQRRWPVQETVVRLEAVALYPKVALPKDEHVLHFSVTRKMASDYL